MTDKPFACRHGTSLWLPCRGCQASVDEACREFERDVFFGLCGPRGHTPRELAAKARAEKHAQKGAA